MKTMNSSPLGTWGFQLTNPRRYNKQLLMHFIHQRSHKYDRFHIVFTYHYFTMKAYVRDDEWRAHGLPPTLRKEARNCILAIGRSRYVTPLVLRRIDEGRWTDCGLRLAYFEGRRCVWAALPGICVIFEQEDVRRSIFLRVRSRPYTWRR